MAQPGVFRTQWIPGFPKVYSGRTTNLSRRGPQSIRGVVIALGTAIRQLSHSLAHMDTRAKTAQSLCTLDKCWTRERIVGSSLGGSSRNEYVGHRLTFCNQIVPDITAHT